MIYDYVVTKPPLDEKTLMHYGVKGMKWKNRKSNTLKNNWKNRAMYDSRRVPTLIREGFKDYNATSQNRDQQFEEQKYIRDKDKEKDKRKEQLKKKKENHLNAVWSERNRKKPLKSFKDYNATGQNRDQQFEEQRATRKKKK